MPAAAVTTPNRFAAAPVRLSRANLSGHRRDRRNGRLRACRHRDIGIRKRRDGTRGRRRPGDDRRGGCRGGLGCSPAEVLHLSTGVIGTRLPVDLVGAAVVRVATDGLAATDDALESAAVALRTTDSTTKRRDRDGAGARGRWAGTVAITVTGIAKGVGMIHPRMATMLSILLTDATADPGTLRDLLAGAAATTWNQLSVDGDTSTNDSVFVLASGRAGAASAASDSGARAALAAAIEAVARDLARQQAADGEGATALITCQVSGAADDADARAIARAVVASSLVKAAVHGRDPNWGRVAGAAGNAIVAEAATLEAAGLFPAEAAARAGQPATIDPALMRIAISRHLVYDGARGGPQPVDRDAVREAMGGGEVLIRVDVGLGAGAGEAFGCDLTEGYVRENSEYTS